MWAPNIAVMFSFCALSTVSSWAKQEVRAANFLRSRRTSALLAC